MDHLTSPKLPVRTAVTPAESHRDIWAARLALAQGVFYSVTGVWPLLHMRSFLWVTGPKEDLWLVRTVAGLLSVIGAALWAAGRQRRVTREIGIVGGGSAAVLLAVDLVYVMKEVISPIYLLDAAVEVGIVAAWIGCAALRLPNAPALHDRPSQR